MTNQPTRRLLQSAEAQAITQKIGQNLLARRIGHIASVPVLPLLYVHLPRDKPNPYAAEMVKRLQPFCVALYEVVVYSNNVAGALCPPCEDCRKTCRQSFALPGGH